MAQRAQGRDDDLDACVCSSHATVMLGVSQGMERDVGFLFEWRGQRIHT